MEGSTAEYKKFYRLAELESKVFMNIFETQFTLKVFIEIATKYWEISEIQIQI